MSDSCSPADMAAEAERLCERADDAAMDFHPAKAELFARRAVRLFRDAARLASEPERSSWFVRAVEIGEQACGHKTLMKLIREACEGDPSFEAVETLRDYWEACAWEGEPFPEPVPRGSKTLMDRKDPLPGQLVLFTEAPADA